MRAPFLLLKEIETATALRLKSQGWWVANWINRQVMN